MDFLRKLNIPQAIIRVISKEYGVETEAKIRRDPYYALRRASGDFRCRHDCAHPTGRSC